MTHTHVKFIDSYAPQNFHNKPVLSNLLKLRLFLKQKKKYTPHCSGLVNYKAHFYVP